MKKTGSTIKSPKMLEPSPELIDMQAFMPIDQGDRDRLMRDIKESGEIRDPIKVYQSRDGKWMILGGYNRWRIAAELGMSVVPIDVYDGTTAELRELVIKDNLNRRHLTAEQKRSLISYFLKNDPEQSNKSIAKKTGSTKETVKKQRTVLEAGGEIRPLKTARGDDGKTYRKTEKVTAPKPKPVPKRDDKAIIRETVGDIKFSIKSSLSSVPKDLRKAVIKDILAYLKGL